MQDLKNYYQLQFLCPDCGDNNYKENNDNKTVKCNSCNKTFLSTDFFSSTKPEEDIQEIKD